MLLKSILSYLSRNRWPALLWTFLMVVACTLPGKSLPDAPTLQFDKVVHVGLFVGFTFLWLLLFPDKTVLLVLIGVSFGIFLEFYQQWLPFDRSFDWWDAVADGVGTLLGALLFMLIFNETDYEFTNRKS